MRKIFKRSFFGYEPYLVRKKISVLRYEYNNELEPLKEELRLLTNENEKLRLEVKEMKEKLLKSKEIELKIQEVLYNTHIEAYAKAYNMEDKNEEIVSKESNITVHCKWTNHYEVIRWFEMGD